LSTRYNYCKYHIFKYYLFYYSYIKRRGWWRSNERSIAIQWLFWGVPRPLGAKWQHTCGQRSSLWWALSKNYKHMFVDLITFPVYTFPGCIMIVWCSIRSRCSTFIYFL